jgi:hypothetical protein
LPRVEVNEEEGNRLRHGQQARVARVAAGGKLPQPGGEVAVFGPEDHFIGVARLDGAARSLKPVRILSTENTTS